MSKVIVIKTKAATVMEDIARAFEYADLKNTLPPGVGTIIRGTLNKQCFSSCENTMPWQIDGILRILKREGYEKITGLFDDSAILNPIRGVVNNRLDIPFSSWGHPILYNNLMEDIRWITYLPQVRLRCLDEIFPQGIEIPEYCLGRSLINVLPILPHQNIVFTGATHSLLGALLNWKRFYCYPRLEQALIDLLALQKEISTGIFSVIQLDKSCFYKTDIDNCREGNENYGNKWDSLIIMGADPIATDSIIASLMNYEPLDIPFIRMAHEDQLGIGKLKNIQVLGDEISGLRIIWPYPPKGFYGNIIPGFLAKYFGNADDKTGYYLNRAVKYFNSKWENKSWCLYRFKRNNRYWFQDKQEQHFVNY